MKIDWFTFVAQIINFAILVYLLNRFLYGPITRAMQKREDQIAERLKQAEDQMHRAETERDKYAHLSQQLEVQRSDLFENARQDADAAHERLLAQAKSEVSARRNDWLTTLQREKELLVDLVRQRASQQVVETSRAALSQLADAELEEQVINNFLERLKHLSADELKLIQQEAEKGQTAIVHTAFDITTIWRERIRAVLNQINLNDIKFQTVPELVCGIELQFGGHKIGWSVDEYLTSLSDEMGKLVAQEK